ncbi:MAG: Na/Pi cotransporter family protein [Candidatus Pacearchaeota archaeon]|nr:Na/Pi cotransporter family protein [Candidatus Pacearchaeota archaeon]
METYSIILSITGIIMFLYGILQLSKKLESVVKEKIAFYLRKITQNPLRGTVFGFIVTAINQSSTATTVLTIALVSSGLLSFYSSLGILFGANIGTTLIVNLVAFGITKIFVIFLLLGFLLFSINKTKKTGEIVFYIGGIFFGLFLLSFALESMKYDPSFTSILAKTSPILALLYSVVFTAIIQSSAITVSSAILMGQQGLIELPIIMAIIIGANIGTTATALLASFGSSLNGKRTALAHFLFNIGGALIFLLFFNQAHLLLSLINMPLANKAALFHVLFNVITAIIFLILIRPFSQTIMKILPGKDETITFLPYYLNKAFIKKPEIALGLVRKELEREFILAEKMLKKTAPLIEKFNHKKFQEINYLEEAVNNLQGEIASFLDELSRKNILTRKQLSMVVSYALIVDAIERIADRTLNIAQIARYRWLNREEVSRETLKQLKEILQETITLNSNCIASFRTKKYDQGLEQEILGKLKELKKDYKERLKNNKEAPASAMFFSDTIINIQRIVYNCTDIASHLR